MSEVRPLTADAVIVSDDQVLLMARNHPPCEGQWVLPGGYVEPAETASDACIREAKEEVGLEVAVDLFIDLYDDPERDERGNVSAAYLCHPTTETRPTGGAEARTVEWFDPDDLPELGFDHERIVNDAFRLVRAQTR